MPGRIEKTVFISYRRTNVPWALAIYQNLTMHGYDVFFDYQNIDSGDFEKVILENIKTRAHFLVILTPSALERCKNPDDWLRREIETAMDEKRNIVPLMLESFDFGSPSVKEALTGKLAALSTFNGLRVYSEYFFEAMDKLRERYMNVEVRETTALFLNAEATKITETQKIAANGAPPVEKEELTAQEWFERAFVFNQEENYDEAIRCTTNAINLQPDFAGAYYVRGYAKYIKGNYDAALSDLNQAIFIEPKHYGAHANRAVIRESANDWDGAVADYTDVIQTEELDTNIIAETYHRRGRANFIQGKADQAIKDFTKAIELSPNSEGYHCSRGMARVVSGDHDAAIADFDEAIRTNPGNFEAYFGRGLAHGAKKDIYRAIADIDKTIYLKPDYADAYELRASICEDMKDWKNALAGYEKYLELCKGIQDDDQKEIEIKIKKLKGKLTKKKSAKKKLK